MGCDDLVYGVKVLDSAAFALYQLFDYAYFNLHNQQHNVHAMVCQYSVEHFSKRVPLFMQIMHRRAVGARGTCNTRAS